MENKNEIQQYQPTTQGMTAFESTNSFVEAQRMAQALSASTMVPTAYQNNVANTLVAIEMAQRMGESPLMVMQSLNIIHGKPSFGSAFIIARLNTCKRFASSIKFAMSGEGMNLTCFAWTADHAGNVLQGPPVSMQMAKAEGWIDKKGSKWQTMPELMIQYRSAAFFCRLHAPELLMGMRTSEEINDIGFGRESETMNNRQNAKDLNQMLNNRTEPIQAEFINNDDGVI